METCDVIIPLYGNEGVIEKTLSALYAQRVPDKWRVRVLLSDDGSSDRTLERALHVLHPPTASWDRPVALRGVHGGAAQARNRGIDFSRAHILLFLGADILLRPHALSEHLEFHRHYPDKVYAGLGIVKWDPRICPTAFMEWMIHGGPQNNFDDLLGIQSADPRHFFYASHVSLKRDFLGEDLRFCTSYSGYGWEDLDLGRTLAQKSLTLRVLHRAVGLHVHSMSMRDVLQRQRSSGRSLIIYQRRYAHTILLPYATSGRVFRTIIYTRLHIHAVAHALLSFFPNVSAPRLFMRIATAELLAGMEDAFRSGENNRAL